MKCAFLLDVVIGKCATVFQLLSSKDQTLLIRWDAFLVLNLLLNVFDRIASLNFEGNGLARECLQW
jgi:hypothetical protein